MTLERKEENSRVVREVINALLGVVFCLGLLVTCSGCASNNELITIEDTERTRSPMGFELYCTTHPQRVECGGGR